MTHKPPPRNCILFLLVFKKAYSRISTKIIYSLVFEFSSRWYTRVFSPLLILSLLKIGCGNFVFRAAATSSSSSSSKLSLFIHNTSSGRSHREIFSFNVRIWIVVKFIVIYAGNLVEVLIKDLVQKSRRALFFQLLREHWYSKRAHVRHITEALTKLLQENKCISHEVSVVNAEINKPPQLTQSARVIQPPYKVDLIRCL